MTQTCSQQLLITATTSSRSSQSQSQMQQLRALTALQTQTSQQQPAVLQAFHCCHRARPSKKQRPQAALPAGLLLPLPPQAALAPQNACSSSFSTAASALRSQQAAGRHRGALAVTLQRLQQQQQQRTCLLCLKLQLLRNVGARLHPPRPSACLTSMVRRRHRGSRQQQLLQLQREPRRNSLAQQQQQMTRLAQCLPAGRLSSATSTQTTPPPQHMAGTPASARCRWLACRLLWSAAHVNRHSARSSSSSRRRRATQRQQVLSGRHRHWQQLLQGQASLPSGWAVRCA
jgi:hypothetical protein